MTKPIDWNARAIPPQPGKQYWQRNGLITPVLRERGKMVENEHGTLSWFHDGTYLPNREARHPCDLIAEYVPPKPAPKKGEFWITRDGLSVHEITHNDEHGCCCMNFFHWQADGRVDSRDTHPRDLVRRVEVREIEGEGR